MSAIQWTKQEFQLQDFMKDFKHVKALSYGSEGIVSQWSSRATGQVVVVKQSKPHKDKRNSLQREIDILRQISPHDHLVKFFGFITNFSLSEPAPILEYSCLGNSIAYRESLLKKEPRVPEMTLWKLSRDMSLALDWLHNRCGTSYVYGDGKPDNILAFLPKSWNSTGVPLLPTFKLCDFNRTGAAGDFKSYFGTPEYGPPMVERRGPQSPSADMWSLGATIQAFALLLDHDVCPMMLKQDFMVYAEKNLSPRLVYDLREGRTEWRIHIPPVCRPLDASIEYQTTVLRLKILVPPYSRHFNRWYKMLYEEDPLRRVHSSILARHFVPDADDHIEALKRPEMVETFMEWDKKQAQY